MNKLYQIKTEIGDIYVTINKTDGLYIGKIFNSNLNINIKTPTIDSCLIGVKNAFETQIHFWLYKQLLPMNISLKNE